MDLIKLSGKSVNVEGLEMTEKEFNIFFSGQKPWKSMIPKDRAIALKSDYKMFKSKTKKAKLE